MKKTMKIVLATLTAITLSGGTASAATCQPADFRVDGADSKACLVSPGSGKDGNDSASLLNGLNDGAGIFGFNSWSKIVKVDGSSGESTSNDLTLSVSLDDDDNKKSGTWSVTGWGSGHETVMAVLKGGPRFSVYLLDIGKGVSGSWNTQSLVNGGGNSAGLSHLTLYSVETDISTTVAGSPDPSPSPVPLPAAGWLLLAGLGGLAALRRHESPR